MKKLGNSKTIFILVILNLVLFIFSLLKSSETFSFKTLEKRIERNEARIERIYEKLSRLEVQLEASRVILERIEEAVNDPYNSKHNN